MILETNVRQSNQYLKDLSLITTHLLEVFCYNCDLQRFSVFGPDLL